ncbi:rap1 GTPase-GDP dissociation stimulator 1 [Alosa alosa]|uniref:rap1 GTPase-GDP dissociation stimulator 1 n=1 Tax=Alosa alosa TaxID=278164 RepID=UPI00201547A1|nr:rap1 GTPase-GDP dissociation stimulator 1 [Alosa alosa]
MAKRTSSRTSSKTSNRTVSSTDSLANSLNAIRVSTELIEDELRPHLDTLLAIAQERKKGMAELVVESSILPVLAHVLWRKNSVTLKTTKLVAELAREPTIRERCFHTGISSALLSLLGSSDQELLLHVGRAISRIGYDSTLQQEKLLRNGAVPLLASVLLRYPENEALVGSCLQALCSLADMAEEDGSAMVWEPVGHVAQGEWVFRGTYRNTGSALSSAVTVVRLQELAPGQYVVTVEVLQRCSTVFWTAHSNLSSTFPRFPRPHLTGWPKFYKVIKYSVQGYPQKGSWKSKLFHTLL